MLRAQPHDGCKNRNHFKSYLWILALWSKHSNRQLMGSVWAAYGQPNLDQIAKLTVAIQAYPKTRLFNAHLNSSQPYFEFSRRPLPLAIYYSNRSRNFFTSVSASFSCFLSLFRLFSTDFVAFLNSLRAFLYFFVALLSSAIARLSFFGDLVDAFVVSGALDAAALKEQRFSMPRQ